MWVRLGLQNKYVHSQGKVPTCTATAFIFHSLAARRSITTVVLLLNELAGPLQVFFHRPESCQVHF